MPDQNFLFFRKRWRVTWLEDGWTRICWAPAVRRTAHNIIIITSSRLIKGSLSHAWTCLDNDVKGNKQKMLPRLANNGQKCSNFLLRFLPMIFQNIQSGNQNQNGRSSLNVNRIKPPCTQSRTYLPSHQNRKQQRQNEFPIKTS